MNIETAIDKLESIFPGAAFAKIDDERIGVWIDGDVDVEVTLYAQRIDAAIAAFYENADDHEDIDGAGLQAFLAEAQRA